MMKRYILLVVLLLSVSVCLQGIPPELNPTDANIYGHVISKKSREHLAFMTVALKGTTIGTATDASGHYFLKNLPEG